MCDRIEPLTMTKREFIRACCVSAGALAFGLPRPPLATTSTADEAFPGQESSRPGKWSKEALFYETTADGLQCRKCPHECLLDKNESGLCRNRVNLDGKLYSIAYGNPCAVHIDPIEKKPFFHFLPSTRAFSIAAAGCNLRCLNCQNWQISQVSPKETSNEDLMPVAVVAQCRADECESIAYTYSEPTTFLEYVLDTAAAAQEKKIRNVLKSNGYINEKPLRLLCKHLDAANIDLKCFDETIYRRLSSASLAPVLRTLQVLKKEGVWLEITNLVIPTWTDDEDMIKRMCAWLTTNGFADTPLHFSRFMPLHKLTQLPLTPVSVLERAREIAMQTGIRYVYIGNVPMHQAESTFCGRCGKCVIERQGFRIRSRHLNEGRCAFCKEKIPGVWV